jgi:hypothetical protein
LFVVRICCCYSIPHQAIKIGAVANYFRKWFYTFDDVLGNRWRVDILDSQGSVPSEPFELEVAGDPLVGALLNSSRRKDSYILGRQITINYVYNGGVNDPSPDDFFEAEEMRFSVEVRKNGALDGVYYVRPDDSQEPFLYPPYVVTIQAIDGLGFSEGPLFKAYDGSNLVYQTMPLFEAFNTRGLNQILDAATPLPLNAVCSLFPTNGTGKLFSDILVHSDAFIDFVRGAHTVRDVLMDFCTSFNARLFMENGEIWFQRVQDMYLSGLTATVTRYTDAATHADSAPVMIRTIGPEDTGNDGYPINVNGIKVLSVATKKAPFRTSYKGINRLTNFDWAQFDGTNFNQWFRSAGTGAVSREGAGTVADPYKAVLPLDGDALHNMSQGFSGAMVQIRVNPGDIITLDFAHDFYNSVNMFWLIDLDTLTNDWLGWNLNSAGVWQSDGAGITVTDRNEVRRSGKKQRGSVSLKSALIPAPRPNGASATPIPTEYRLSLLFWGPSEAGTIVDGPGGSVIKIGPVKLGVVNFSSEGRRVEAENAARFSTVDDVRNFQFIDTGDDGLSNTLFVAPGVPAATWTTGKPGVADDDIENAMARAQIDQNPRSPYNFQGTIMGSDIGLKNTYTFEAYPGRQFIIVSDSAYNYRDATHEVVMQEIFPEGGANVTITQFDVQDDEND